MSSQISARAYGWLALLLFATSILTMMSPTAVARPDELDVHSDETCQAGQFAIDVISNYSPSGARQRADEGLAPALHVLQISPTLTYGITKSLEVGVQLFSSIAGRGASRVDGARLELLTIPIRPEDEDDDGVFLGGLVEVGRLPRILSLNLLDAEAKGILGYRRGRWTMVSNPEVGVKVVGSGSSRPDLSVKFKLAYRTTDGYSVGVEQYGELGHLGHPRLTNQQSQQTFAVVDYKFKGIDLNVGAGRGWNDFSERWTFKAILSFPLER